MGQDPTQLNLDPGMGLSLEIKPRRSQSSRPAWDQSKLLVKKSLSPGVVVHTFNPSTDNVIEQGGHVPSLRAVTLTYLY